MNIDARINVLRRVPLYEGLDDTALLMVAREAHERHLEKGAPLFTQGEEALHGYVVGRGWLRLEQLTSDGQNVVLRHMGAGDMLGTVAVLRHRPFPATPIAMEECMVLSWSVARLSEQMQRFPAIAVNAIKVIGGRVEELQARLQEIATHRVDRRIAAALLRIVAQSGRPVDGGIEIPFSLSRQDLAEMTATTLHTVSRILSAWDQEGMISSRRSSHLVIRNPERLAEIAR
ncbi:transcriptional regulator [Iodidimonas gelatinilytica]|uniref:Transcriptional regulator n=1 Tax=Iodidimonas gelatinilytica TaxID=1236966 RepID=A0A5A7N069_9PROT|nr:Crp/Fnr family transcriptional regulator [Iodidimonas gelatinilytica]GER01653.1 transcriptional regulator [Iodidimonas gelatinilytica]